MKRNTSLTFFDISSDIENLPKNELFRLTGGDSDIAWEDEIDDVYIDPPGDDDSWDGGGSDDDPDPWEWDDRWDDDEGDGGGNDGGNPGGDPGATTPPQNNEQQNDPFKRDANGNLITTKVGEPYKFTAYDRVDLPERYVRGVFEFQKYEIQLKDGTKIEVEKAVSFTPHGGSETTDFPSFYNSNCHGYAFLGGEYWLIDPAFDSMMRGSNPYYEEVSTMGQADVAILWNGDEMAHSATVIMDDDGFIVFRDTSEHDYVRTYGSVEDFLNDRGGEGYELRYYKSK